MTRWWRLALLPIVLAGCASTGTETPAGIPPAVATSAALQPVATTNEVDAASATSMVAPSQTPARTPSPTPPPPSFTSTPSAVPAMPTPQPPQTAAPTAVAIRATATHTDTPVPPGPTAEPTVGYTPTNTYQVKRLLVGSGQPGRLYAWLEGFWWADELPGRLVVSDDLGATWKGFEGGDARPLGIDYASGALYAQTAGGLSRWNGTAWEPISSEPVMKLAAQFGEPEKMWGISQAQVARSEDGGRTWQMEGGSGQPLDVFLNPQKPGYVYSIAHIWGQHHLSRSTGNRQWDLLPKPDAPGEPIGTWRDTRGVAIDGDSSATYLILANMISSFNPTGSQLWRSDTLDAPNVRDVSWTLLKDFGPEIQVELLASGWNATGSGPALYANIRSEYCPAQGGTCNPEPPWVLHRSLDGGQTWEPIDIPGTAHE